MFYVLINMKIFKIYVCKILSIFFIFTKLKPFGLDIGSEFVISQF